MQIYWIENQWLWTDRRSRNSLRGWAWNDGASPFLTSGSASMLNFGLKGRFCQLF
jgi:hypothetical protein